MLFTTAPKAPPITTATAKSSTLPRMMNCLKPFIGSYPISFKLNFLSVGQGSVGSRVLLFEPTSLFPVPMLHNLHPKDRNARFVTFHGEPREPLSDYYALPVHERLAPVSDPGVAHG